MSIVSTTVCLLTLVCFCYIVGSTVAFTPTTRGISLSALARGGSGQRSTTSAEITTTTTTTTRDDVVLLHSTSSSSSIDPEMFARRLLEYRLAMEHKTHQARSTTATTTSSAAQETRSTPVPIAFPQLQPKVRAELPPSDPVRAERVARSLLEARLTMAMLQANNRQAMAKSKKQETGSTPVPIAFPQLQPKVRAELPPSDPVRAERVARSLLEARLTMAMLQANKQAMAKNKVQEQTARALLLFRLQIERMERQRKLEKKKELFQRELMAARFALPAVATIKASQKQTETETQNELQLHGFKKITSPEEEASIECLQQRASAILAGLGIAGNIKKKN